MQSQCKYCKSFFVQCNSIIDYILGVLASSLFSHWLDAETVLNDFKTEEIHLKLSNYTSETTYH